MDNKTKEVVERIKALPDDRFLFMPQTLPAVSEMVAKTDDLKALATAYQQAADERDRYKAALADLPKEVPTNWLDPLMTGDQSAFKQTEKWDGRDIEALLRGIQDRLRAKVEAALQQEGK